MGNIENKDFLKTKHYPFRNEPDRYLSEYFDDLTGQYNASEERAKLTKLYVTYPIQATKNFIMKPQANKPQRQQLTIRNRPRQKNNFFKRYAKKTDLGGI